MCVFVAVRGCVVIPVWEALWRRRKRRRRRRRCERPNLVGLRRDLQTAGREERERRGLVQ